MNDLEFREQYKRLRDVHPHHFGSAEKLNTTWEYVKDMDLAWFRNLVDRIVLSSDPRQHKYDIAEAVASEKRNRRSVQFAEEVCEATKAWPEITAKGLERVLKHYGAGSLLDAVMKSRKGEV